MTVWRAPGRVNLIGEHTDYNDGFVLPFALPVGVTATVDARDDDVLAVTSSAWPDERVETRPDELEPGTRSGWASYAEGVVWALRRAGHRIDGLEVHLDADLPPGSGLSSSAAVSCSVSGAVADTFGVPLDDASIVDIAHSAESDYLGVPVGVLDQNAVVRCTADHALFLDVRSMESRQVPLVLDGLTFLVIDTRVTHRLADGEYAKRRAECTRAAELLGVPSLRDVTDLESALPRLPDDVLRARVRHVVTENRRVLKTVALLERGDDVRGIGPLLDASHRSLRDDYEVSCAELDVAAASAVAAGAYGARMTGGGFGGSAIALVDTRSVDAVTSAVERAFAEAGHKPPKVFPVVPSAGAHRES
ncbi:galactokinase [uncultured Jatrophihabitans sp.]|uniref:galactokinase n=1 Tax=uncultured Jatrophihabitans sp. TaxID=1610747 RepID=UPI0035CAF709